MAAVQTAPLMHRRRCSPANLEIYPCTPIPPRSVHLEAAFLPAAVLSGGVGHRPGRAAGPFRAAYGEALKPLGDAFIKLVKMIIAPVIFLTIVTGIAGMTHLSTVGRVFGKAMAYFLFFSTLALVVGLVVANVVQPGAGMNINPADLDRPP
jgi:Na+/H+-dicarboxylate symporter